MSYFMPIFFHVELNVRSLLPQGTCAKLLLLPSSFMVKSVLWLILEELSESLSNKLANADFISQVPKTHTGH